MQLDMYSKLPQQPQGGQAVRQDMLLTKQRTGKTTPRTCRVWLSDLYNMLCACRGIASTARDGYHPVEALKPGPIPAQIRTCWWTSPLTLHGVAWHAWCARRSLQSFRVLIIRALT